MSRRLVALAAGLAALILVVCLGLGLHFASDQVAAPQPSPPERHAAEEMMGKKSVAYGARASVAEGQMGKMVAVPAEPAAPPPPPPPPAAKASRPVTISEGEPLISGGLGLRGTGAGGGGTGAGIGYGSAGSGKGGGSLGASLHGASMGAMGRSDSSGRAVADVAPASPPPSYGRSEGTSARGGGLDALLTAGDWDDTKNFSWFLRYRQKATELAGDPARDLDLTRSAVIEVSNARGEPVRGAAVRVLAGERALFSTRTPADGRVFFVPSLDGAGDAKSVTLEVTYEDAQSRSERGLEGKGAATWAVKLDSAPYRRASAMDVAFVVDTTGSMADELRYLQREIHGIAAQVQSSFQPLDLRFALILYRDEGDRYVVSSTDFGPLSRFEKALAAASADGGGDEPEAVDQALTALGQLSWSQGDVAKVAFLVADAPSHPAGRVRALRAGNDARVRGVRLYTLAASDTRPWAELQFRALAQLTLGRYIFLTDDSGVGNAHAEPHIPCYQVQKLAGLIERTLRSEVRGWREEVPSAEVIRNVGAPQQGVCNYDGLAYRL